jgi:hypothetical protein
VDDSGLDRSEGHLKVTDLNACLGWFASHGDASARCRQIAEGSCVHTGKSDASGTDNVPGSQPAHASCSSPCRRRRTGYPSALGLGTGSGHRHDPPA